MLARMIWGTYNHQRGDLTKLLNLVQNKVPQSVRLTEGGGGGGGNRYLGNAQINLEKISGVPPLGKDWKTVMTGFCFCFNNLGRNHSLPLSADVA